jgi:hypothetical protein
MDTNKNEKQSETKVCDLPETESISDKVHRHLRDKNDHISDEDIRNADIDPNANELDDLDSDDTSNKQDEDLENHEKERT